MPRGWGVRGIWQVGELSKQFGMLRVECSGDVWRGEIEKEGRGRILEASSSSHGSVSFVLKAVGSNVI